MSSSVRARSVPVTTFDALVAYEQWRTELAAFSMKTWAGEKPGLLAFVDKMSWLGITLVEGLTRAAVEQWWVELAVAPSTRVTRLAQLRSFLGYCKERGWIAYDVSALLRAPKVAREPRERLDPAELLALVEAADGPRDRCLLALAANLAIRGGEIQRLRLRDVDLDAGEITVRIDKTHEVDIMPITSDLDAELRTWITHYAETAGDDGLAQDSYLIPSQYVVPTTGRVIYRHGKQIGQPFDVVQAALAKIGWAVVKGEGVHTVRRSVARIYFDMIEEATSFDSALLATMTMLHHTRPETTIGYIGRDRMTLARDRALKGQPFLTKLAGDVRRLRSVK